MDAISNLKHWAGQLSPAVATSQANILGVSAAAGLLAHQYFKRWETDPIAYSQFSACLLTALGVFFYQYATLLWTVLYTLEAYTVMNAVLGASIVAYRLSPWHPLAAYPGPAWAKVSKLYWWYQAKIGQTGYTQARLHKEYGLDVIRLGPNWVSVRSVDAIPIVYGGVKGVATGPRASWSKNDWYEGAIRGAVRTSMHQEVDIKHHAMRRKLWDHGFSGKALADYKPQILEFCDKLVRNVTAVAARPPQNEPATIDMALQSSYFSFDVMGVLGFGEPFGMLDAGVKHFFVDTLEKGMAKLIPIHELPWFRMLVRKVVPLPPLLRTFENQNAERFERRLAKGSSRRDLFTYLLGEEESDAGEAYRLTKLQLIADAGLIVVAGSDTTSSFLTWFWYYSVAHPATYAAVRAELATLTPEQLTDTATLAKLPYLNAALNETMRMQPAVPGGLRRIVPAGGAELEGCYIPGGTTVSVPGYAIQHDPRWWGADCDTYRPERWLADSGQYNKNAYLPFSYGSRSCPGKGLAMVEARLAVAALASRFEFAFPPGFGQREFEEGVRDFFTIQNRDLPLIPIPSPLRMAASA